MPPGSGLNASVWIGFAPMPGCNWPSPSERRESASRAASLPGSVKDRPIPRRNTLRGHAAACRPGRQAGSHLAIPGLSRFLTLRAGCRAFAGDTGFVQATDCLIKSILQQLLRGLFLIPAPRKFPKIIKTYQNIRNEPHFERLRRTHSKCVFLLILGRILIIFAKIQEEFFHSFPDRFWKILIFAACFEASFAVRRIVMLVIYRKGGD